MKPVASLLIRSAIGFAFSVLLVRPAYSHGGGLDAYGCHHDRKVGHRGSLGGQFFSSKEEMLKRLKNASISANSTQNKFENRDGIKFKRLLIASHSMINDGSLGGGNFGLSLRRKYILTQ
jgi:hypothetical protein